MYSNSWLNTTPSNYMEISLGLSKTENHIFSPGNSDISTGGRVLSIYHEYSSTSLKETVQIPEFKVRCKKSGIYTVVFGITNTNAHIGYAYSGPGIYANCDLKFNGESINPYYSVTGTSNQGGSNTQSFYVRNFKSGDTFTIKHRGGTYRVNSYSSETDTWDDDTVRFLIYGSSMTLIYTINVVVYGYDIQADGNDVIRTPTNLSSSFEAYV